MEMKLNDACLKGDVEMLEALMRDDKLTLARVSISSCINQTPLHLASMLGHFELAKSLLSYMPNFASRLNSEARSPLHLAAANGYAKIVELLIEQDPNMCRVPDEDGRTPLHLAVMNGQDECVSELIKVDAQYETILHLCVMYNRLKVLVLIIESTDQDLSNIRDENGNTILHFATALGRMQIIKYLVTSRSEVAVNEVNGNGLTALDIMEDMPRKDAKNMEIKELLISAGALRANKAIEAECTKAAAAATTTNRKGERVSILKMVKNFFMFEDKDPIKDQSILVAASVICAMAYQAAMTPPGGVSEMDGEGAGVPAPVPSPSKLYPNLTPEDNRFFPVSEAIKPFWISNTIAFMAALCVMFVFVSGFPLRRRLYIWLIRGTMWITIAAMACAMMVLMAISLVLALSKVLGPVIQNKKAHRQMLTTNTNAMA